MFIAFDGIDGSGKSTHVLKLYKNLQEKFPDKEIIITNEPYDNNFAYDLYFQIYSKHKDELNWKIKAHLFGVARLQLWLKKIKPALDRKAIVISDRWYKSTLAYQGAINNNHDEIFKILHNLDNIQKPNIYFIFKAEWNKMLVRLKEKENLNQNNTGYFKKVNEFYFSNNDENNFYIDPLENLKINTEIILSTVIDKINAV